MIRTKRGGVEAWEVWRLKAQKREKETKERQRQEKKYHKGKWWELGTSRSEGAE